MSVVLMGNTAPVQVRRVEVSEEEGEARDDLRVLGPVGDQPGVVEAEHRIRIEPTGEPTIIRIPGARRKSEALHEIHSLWGRYHSEDPPEWVASDDEGLAADIAAEFTYGDHTCELRPLPEGFADAERAAVIEHIKALAAQITPEEWDETLAQIDGPQALKTNAGHDFQARVMAESGATGAGTGGSRPADFLALTEDATAPAAGDTSFAAELTDTGLARAAATYAHTAGAANYTLTKAFANNGASARTPRKVGVFNASSAGTMVFASLIPTPPTLNTGGDQMTLTETVNT